VTGHVRPAVIATLLQDVDLVIGLRPLLRLVQPAVGAEVEALRVAVAYVYTWLRTPSSNGLSSGMLPSTLRRRVLPWYATQSCARTSAAVGSRCAWLGWQKCSKRFAPWSPM